MESSKQRPLRVLAADDSAVMRRVLKTVFDLHEQGSEHGLPPMELCGIVCDGVECLEAVGRLRPDVLLLDLEMPRMNGLEVLRKLLVAAPSLPVIMCSAYTESGARATIEALSFGAKDYVMKPSSQSDFAAALDVLMEQLLPRIAALAAGRLAVAETRLITPAFDSHGASSLPLRLSHPAYESSASATTPNNPGARVDIVVVGVSTGGPSALEAMLPMLASDFPVPVLIVQHMPKLFTGALAQRLDRCCALRVMQGVDGGLVEPGTVWLAPGDAHMEVCLGSAVDRRRPRRSVVKLHYGEPVNHCLPSVDRLFHSVARLYGAGTLALVMTGMGADGLDGCRALQKVNGQVLAQDEATSAVWGMPGQVARAGLATAVLPLSALAAELSRRASVGRQREPPYASPGTENLKREAMHGLL